MSAMDRKEGRGARGEVDGLAYGCKLGIMTAAPLRESFSALYSKCSCMTHLLHLLLLLLRLLRTRGCGSDSDVIVIFLFLRLWLDSLRSTCFILFLKVGPKKNKNCVRKVSPVKVKWA